jgi:hypothetical protein
MTRTTGIFTVILSPAQLDALVGLPVDIASSAYRYRADRAAAENPPESWLALMWYAGQPLNRPIDLHAPAMARVLCSLLWEEIRPIETVELSWPASGYRPAPDELRLPSRKGATAGQFRPIGAEDTAPQTATGWAPEARTPVSGSKNVIEALANPPVSTAIRHASWQNRNLSLRGAAC